MATKIEDSDVLIIGGGSSGFSLAARLRRIAPELGVSVIEPSERHFYQPLWTLVGAGVLPKEKTVRPRPRSFPAASAGSRKQRPSSTPTTTR